MSVLKLTKRRIDALKCNGTEFTAWDNAVTGFGVRVRATGAKSYVVVYRAGSGRGSPVRRYTIASVGKVTPDEARARAKAILGSVAHGKDPSGDRTTERGVPTVAKVADCFLSDHVKSKRKQSTAAHYRDILDRLVKPSLGTTKADKLTRMQVSKLHLSLCETPFQANRVLAVIGSMYAFAGRAGFVPEGTNPVRGIEKFKEARRERFLTKEELSRLGAAIREAESIGIACPVDVANENSKHTPKSARAKLNSHAAAALRLLLFTGCRLREILHLRWDYVDFDRGLLFLPDSKNGRKTVILNAPALEVLSGLKRVGPYVVLGEDPERPRADLKRPWQIVSLHAGLKGVRLHDLRHTYASFGAGGGLGLPIIGRLLGHTQMATTARYAHLDNDPLRCASESIAGQIASALSGNHSAKVIKLADFG